MIDISTEQYREYVYPDGIYKIVTPVELHITEKGTHRIVDAAGVTHRPSPGYLAIRWLPNSGAPAFVA